MCGRARVTQSAMATMRHICQTYNEKSNEELLSNETHNEQAKSADYNIENLSPGMECPVVMYDRCSHRFTITPMVWGLVPSYERLGSNERPDHFKIFNKRIEKLENPYFANLVKGDATKSSHRNRRCLVIVDGFYEWKPSLGKKQPYYISSDVPFMFPAIWDSIKVSGPNGPEVLQSFAILTCDSSDFLAAEIHNRQPVMLSESQIATWIDPNASSSDISKLLKEIAGNAANPEFSINFNIKLHPVTKEMTNPKYQQEDCSKPIKLDATIDTVFKREGSPKQKPSQKRSVKLAEKSEESPEEVVKKKKKATMVDYFKK